MGRIGRSGDLAAVDGRELARDGEQLDAELVAVEQPGPVLALQDPEQRGVVHQRRRRAGQRQLDGRDGSGHVARLGRRGRFPGVPARQEVVEHRIEPRRVEAAVRHQLGQQVVLADTRRQPLVTDLDVQLARGDDAQHSEIEQPGGVADHITHRAQVDHPRH
jgi:hypothetical protein